MKIAWLGSITTPEACKNNKAISLASNYWQESFIKALEDSSVRTTTISTLPHQAFPFGPLLVKPSANDFVSTNVLIHKYINIKGLKNCSEAYGMQKSLKKIHKLDAVVSYNPYFPCRIAAANFSKKHKLPWVEICADSVASSPGWEILYNEKKIPDGFVFLSAEAFKRCPFDNKILIHGGIPDSLEYDERNFQDNVEDESDDSVSFLYSGSFEYWSGLNLILKAFTNSTFNKTCELIICGYGKLSKEDQRLINNDNRIKFFGTVSKLELHDLRKKTQILVNPRPLIDENIFNFPSKLLEYMSYGKIIVSTKTPGIPSHFKEMMLLTSDNLSDFSNTLMHASKMNANEKKPILTKLTEYSKAHTWLYEVNRFLSFLKTLTQETK